MNVTPLLAPVAVLVFWSLLVLLWLAIARAGAFRQAGVTLDNMPRGARMSDLRNDRMPARASWVSDNYIHLMEQPTIFYATIAVLALAGDTSPLSLAAAWAYTGLRVLHSIWQCFVNIIPVRALLFIASTGCLWVLAIRAVRITVFL